jgi:hypothetical protein
MKLEFSLSHIKAVLIFNECIEAMVAVLVQVSETMAASNNGHLPNSLDDGEDKPMLIVKKTGDGPGITALINRQLQGKLHSISTVRIMMDLIDINFKSNVQDPRWRMFQFLQKISHSQLCLYLFIWRF